jgi:hypothetical protein
MPKKKGKKQKTKKQKGKGLYDKAVNKLTGSNLKPGEKHPILYVDGKFVPGAFLGPGTDLIPKIKAGVKPISAADKSAQAHDLRYYFAKNKKDVREADILAIKKAKELRKTKKDNKFNTYQLQLGLKGKILAEKAGVPPRAFTSYADYKKDIPENQAIARKKLDELIQEGYGKKKRKPSAWSRHVQAVRKKHPDKSFKQCLVLASKSYKK